MAELFAENLLSHVWRGTVVYEDEKCIWSLLVSHLPFLGSLELCLSHREQRGLEVLV